MPKAKKGKGSKNQQQEIKQYKVAARPYQTFFTTAALQSYTAYYDRAEKAKQRGDLTNDHVKKLRMIDEAIEEIIPQAPTNRKYALAGKLSGIFRVQKGRLRICWMASSEQRQIIIVFVSETLRKAGDVSDPYHLLTNMVLSGEFDGLFEQLGITPAPLKAKRISLFTQ